MILVCGGAFGVWQSFYLFFIFFFNIRFGSSMIFGVMMLH